MHKIARSGSIELSIIIVTWNSIDYTRACLESIRRGAPAVDMEIIVVDNNSSDGTADFIQGNFPEVRLIRNQINEGFARGNNRGIQACCGRYIALINSDVIVHSACLSRLHAFMEANPTIGIAGPAMLGSGGELRRSCMRFPTLWGSFCRALALDSVFKHSAFFARLLMGDFRHDRVMDVEVLNGWFWIVRREALQPVGELDERFFMYGEDIDWCFRFFSAGWRVVFYPEAEATHYGGASSANAPTRFYVEMQKANVEFWKKHHGHVASCVYLAIQWLHQILRVVGYGVTYLLTSKSRISVTHKLRRSVKCLHELARSSPPRECVAE